MLKRTNTYSYSVDGGKLYYGDYSSKEDAIKFAMMEDEIYLIGENYKFIPSLPSAADIIDCITQEAEEDTGGAISDYLTDVTAEEMLKLETMLQATLEKWLKETGHEPDFFIAEEL